MALDTFYPEMGWERKPGTTIHARSSQYKGYSLKSKDELPKMRGLEFYQTLKSEHLVDNPKAQAYAGWHQYYATQAALDRLCKIFDVSLELLLD